VNLTEVLRFLGVEYPTNACSLQNIQLDSRQAQTGDLFCAMPGEKIDGRHFVQEAIKNGAAAILVESPYPEAKTNLKVPIIEIPELSKRITQLSAFFYNYPSRGLRLIGVTGTNGKTSCSHYTAQILNAGHKSCGVMGTLGNGMLPNLTQSQLTTSDCCNFQRQLNEFLSNNVDYVAMEVSSHALVQGRIDGAIFDTAIFTNLSQDHLDYHGTMEEYFKSKATLFTNFRPATIIINLDDPYADRLLKLITYKTRVLTYSLINPVADVYYQRNKIFTPWGVGIVFSPLIGRFNMSNLLACIACCGNHNMPLELMLEAVRNITPVAGRMQQVKPLSAEDPLVVIDYAHTPDALTKALQALREIKDRTINCIFGCGGDRDREKRPLMLQAALQYADKITITQDNSRTEDPQQIFNDILSNHVVGGNVVVQLDRATAINNAIMQAKPKEIILIAGKGHEDYQIIGTEKFPFSDLEVAQKALATRSKSAWA